MTGETFEALRAETIDALKEGLGRLLTADEVDAMQEFLEELAEDLTYYGRAGNAQGIQWTLARAKIRGIRLAVRANETVWDVLENAGKIAGAFLGELAAAGIRQLLGGNILTLLERAGAVSAGQEEESPETTAP